MNNIYPYFSQNPLDRLDHIRRDQQKIEELKNSPTSLYILFEDGNILVDEENGTCYFSKTNLDTTQAVLLGRDKNIDYFALHVKNDMPKISIKEFVEKGILQEKWLGIVAQGAAVLNWHQSHQYCSSCGNKTIMSHAGWKRDCLTCKKEHFPRTDPVVMMLVTHGDYCLLGRGVNFLPNRYSCLAGFMESGESIEDAARRELFEEAGVIGLEVTYKMCQPWPFPNTLMIGVHVNAKSKELHIDTHEIAEARWVHKDDLKAILDGDESFGISVPRKIAISRNLLESWV